MCGIAGGVWTDPRRAIGPEILGRMLAAIRHRGPDDEGQWSHVGPPGVALGHRRLAIVDPAGGRQPLTNEDGRIQLVANGEVYNYPQLRKELEARGHRFRTRSDNEAIVHLYEEYGPAAVEHINGMFAFALWDAGRQQLLLARDRLGEKPLVYADDGGRLAFASELKALLHLPDVRREVEPAALDAYLLYQYVPHPRTILRGVSKLPPGHLAVWREGRLEVRRYWRIDPRIERTLPAEEYARELRRLASESVAMRLQSDVPVGAFLSGGVDSTIVVGLMRQSAGRVKTFSIGFGEPRYDETRYARLVAERFETEHVELRIEADAAGLLARLAAHYDEPFGDSSALPTWHVASLARREVTVALTGDGGDELFAGYPRYQAVRLGAWLDRLPAVRRLAAAAFWQRLPAGGAQRGLLRRWRRFAEAAAMEPGRRYLEWISIFGEARRRGLYRPEFAAALADDPAEFVLAEIRAADRRDAVTAASLADAQTYLPCDLLTKVDIAAMAHGLETRPPLLDHRLVELAAAMPASLKLRGRRGKWLLRQAFGDLLPAEVARRPKMGFGVPLAEWFRGPLLGMLRDLLLDARALARPYFRPEAVRQLIDEHASGRFDHGYRLWSLLMLELWHRTWLEGMA